MRRTGGGDRLTRDGSHENGQKEVLKRDLRKEGSTQSNRERLQGWPQQQRDMGHKQHFLEGKTKRHWKRSGGDTVIGDRGPRFSSTGAGGGGYYGTTRTCGKKKQVRRAECGRERVILLVFSSKTAKARICLVHAGGHVNRKSRMSNTSLRERSSKDEGLTTANEQSLEGHLLTNLFKIPSCVCLNKNIWCSSKNWENEVSSESPLRGRSGDNRRLGGIKRNFSKGGFKSDTA